MSIIVSKNVSIQKNAEKMLDRKNTSMYNGDINTYRLCQFILDFCSIQCELT